MGCMRVKRYLRSLAHLAGEIKAGCSLSSLIALDSSCVGHPTGVILYLFIFVNLMCAFTAIKDI